MSEKPWSLRRLVKNLGSERAQEEFSALETQKETAHRILAGGAGLPKGGDTYQARADAALAALEDEPNTEPLPKESR